MVLVIVIVKVIVIVIRILIVIVTVNGNSNSNSNGIDDCDSNWHNLIPGSAWRAKWSQGGQEGGRGRPEPPEPAMTANGMAQGAARTGQMTG